MIEIKSVKEEKSSKMVWKDPRWSRIFLLTIIGLGIFFRIYGLGNKIYSHDEAFTSLRSAGYHEEDVLSSLWDGNDKTVDEIQKYIKPSEQTDIGDTYTILARYEPHEAPIFFLLAHYWMRTVGYTPAAMRGLSAFFSLLSIPALYWLSRELFKSSRVIFLATIFISLSPYQILYAQDARPYSLLTLATLVSSAALLRAIRKNTIMGWMVYCLSLVFGIYSHQLFALVAIVHALHIVGKHKLSSARMYGGFLTASGFALIAFGPWLFLIITNWEQAAVRMGWVNIQIPWYRYIQRWMVNFSSPFIDLDFNSGNLFPYLLRALLLVGVTFAYFFILKHGSNQQRKFLLLLFFVPAGSLIIPDVLLGGIRSIGGRYFVPSNISTILVLAFVLGNKLSQTDSNAKNKWIFLTSLLITASIISNVNGLHAKTWWNKELGRIRPEFAQKINMNGNLLIVSGYLPTNLGDVLSLSFEVDQYVRIRLYKDPSDINIKNPGDYQNIFWFPSSYEEVQEISTKAQFQVTEVLSGTLWQIYNEMEK